MCQFSGKMDNADFFGLNLPKIGFLLEIQKANVGIRISIHEIPCEAIFRQKRQFSGKKDFSVQICPKMNFGIGSLDSESVSPI